MRRVDFEQFEYALNTLSECTDDYVFILDYDNDHYMISERAAKDFSFETCSFSNATQEFRKIMYPSDYQMVIDDLNSVREQKTQTHDLEYRWFDKNGNPVWISCRGKAILGEDGKAHYLVGRVAELGKQNKIDNVTSLHKEIVFKMNFEQAAQQGSYNGYIIEIGIDNFKEINEKFGLQFGDKVLSDVAICLRECTDKTHRIYKMDGDEFLIYSKTKPDKLSDIVDVYKNIRRAIDKSIMDSGYSIFYTISAGIVVFDSSKDTFENVRKKGRFSLHSAKLSGKNTYSIYDDKEYEEYVRKLDIQSCLRTAIQEDYKEFEMYYQPIINTETDEIDGAEALLRWNSKKYGFMSPVEFIPLLEESALIVPLGKWIITTAVKQCKKWQEYINGFKMNINLSYVQLQKSDLIHDALKMIDEVGITYDSVIFEVTESIQIETNEIMRGVLKSFTDNKFVLAIDDFGSGYSNFRYIKEMMFDWVKIDRIFIQNVQKSENDFMLLKHMTDLAHSLNLKVCYEGVETKEQLDKVRMLRPDHIQGFYYSKPITADLFEKMICNTVLANAN